MMIYGDAPFTMPTRASTQKEDLSIRTYRGKKTLQAHDQACQDHLPRASLKTICRAPSVSSTRWQASIEGRRVWQNAFAGSDIRRTRNAHGYDEETVARVKCAKMSACHESRKRLVTIYKREMTTQRVRSPRRSIHLPPVVKLSRSDAPKHASRSSFIQPDGKGRKPTPRRCRS